MKFSIATIVTILASSALAAPTKELNQRFPNHALGASESTHFTKRQTQAVTNVLNKVLDQGQKESQDGNGNTKETNTNDPEAEAAANRAVQIAQQAQAMNEAPNPAAGSFAPIATEGFQQPESGEDAFEAHEDMATGTDTPAATGTAAATDATSAPAPTQVPPTPASPAAAAAGGGGAADILSLVTGLLSGAK